MDWIYFPELVLILRSADMRFMGVKISLWTCTPKILLLKINFLKPTDCQC